MNAFTILGVNKDSTDEEIRKSYLELVKRYSPDNHPSIFQKINDAYEKINTERKRMNYLLFNSFDRENSPIEVLHSHASWPLNRKPLSFKAMKELLRSCAVK